MQKHYTIVWMFLFCSISMFAQNLDVQTWNYNSVTRDTVIEFPDVDHNNYEKILMYYSMRCKNGLVSPPQQGQTNIGCGEWDYSCNTSIIDSSRVDSLFTVSPSHRISNFEGLTFEYVNNPTYTYYESTQYETVYDNITSENEVSLDDGNGVNTDILFGDNQQIVRFQALYPANILSENGLATGAMTGLKFDFAEAGAGYQALRIRMKASTKNALSADDIDEDGFQQVYFRNTDFESGANYMRFYEDFDWDGTSNVLVDISYVNPNGANLSTQMFSQSIGSTLHSNASSDTNVELRGATHADINTPFDEIENEITISFWAFGSDILPINTTILEGVDAANRRQANVHLPWGNGQVMWDCGNVNGYDRIAKDANTNEIKGKWNHWAFTKNANTGSMKIYLNGNLWHSGTGKNRPIDIQKFRIGKNNNGNVGYYGNVDEFRIWSTELSTSEIQAWMNKSITSSHPSYADLVAYYPFDENNGNTLTDASENGYHGTFNGPLAYRNRKAEDLNFNVTESGFLPLFTFVQTETAEKTVEPIVIRDSIINLPNQVDAYILEGTDLVLSDSYFVYRSGSMPIFDENGTLLGNVNVAPEGTITISQLEHYAKHPSKIEIMSFVTPYGINLDLGHEGRTWVFDVTDFGPILKGKKRILMDRGGQWQEEMDIRFEYIEGTPSRPVLDMQQVWRVTSESHTRINDDSRFEPVMMPLRADASAYKLRAAITGHGQEGEFIPRMHYLNVDGGVREAEWQVWKECSENPIYPQGGTWIYDRAGWCPGMATDVQELDITPYVTPGTSTEIDYGMAVASGSSNYIVNVQMVSYGEANFALDAELLDVINPSQKTEHGRFNPMCGNPSVVIRNNGTTPLTSLEISYDVNGEDTQYYTWNGFLNYLETEEVVLPAMNASLMVQNDAIFNVSIGNPNNNTDGYINNNTISTNIDVVPQYNSGIIVRLRTNNFGGETSWRLYDTNNNIIESRTFGMSANTTYLDTIPDLNGCYRLEVRDSDDDGISFWANNDGNGSVSVSDLSLPIHNFQSIATDFGGFVQYQFVAGDLSSARDITSNRIFELYPNPTNDQVQVNLGGFEGALELRLVNQLGQVVLTKALGASSYERTETLNLNSFENGVYYVQIIENEQTLSRKLVKTSL